MPATPKRPRYWTPTKVSVLPSTVETELATCRTQLNSLKLEGVRKDDDVFLHLTSVLGFKMLSVLLAANNHIPLNFPNRLTYVCNILNSASSRSYNLDHVAHYISLLQRTLYDIPLVDITDILWETSARESAPYLTFLSPSVTICLQPMCGGKLFCTDRPSRVTVFTMMGPLPGQKAVLTCRKCSSKYSIDTYHEANGQARYYPSHLKPNMVAASNKVFLSRELYEMFCESGNHAFVSALAFAEMYNSVFSEQHTSSRKFSLWIQSLTRTIDGNQNNHADWIAYQEPVCTAGDANNVEDKADKNLEILTRTEITKSGCVKTLTRKAVMEAFLNGELEKEVDERQMTEIVSFGSTSDREVIMQHIDKLRRDELYPHEDSECSAVCQSRGCKNLRVIDGCWKVCIPHCMLAVPTHVQGYPLLNFPDVCTNEPAPSSVFCHEHIQLLKRHGVPTIKAEFLKFIGCQELPSTSDAMKRLDERVLEFTKNLLAKDQLEQTVGTSATQYQGTQDMISSMVPDILNSVDNQPICNKDTGEKSRLRQRARGHFAAVSGGGNILCFNPIYKSESPSQVFMLVIKMIYLEMKDVPKHKLEEKLTNYILCYDNICHLDSLKAARGDLPLPGELKDLWRKIQKIIDRLHIQNHKDKLCKDKYSPEQLKDNGEPLLPKGYNTMAGEQLFAWMARFKKIVNSMSQTHHLFYLHRMCKRRNSYTARCRRQGIEPVFPGINKSTLK